MTHSVSFKSNTEHDNQFKREKVSGGATGVVAALASGVPGVATLPVTTKIILPAMQKAGDLDSVTIAKIQDGARQAWRDTGLKNKGVIVNFIKQVADKNLTIRDLMDPIVSVKKGVNAFFLPKDVKNIFGLVIYPKNTILIPEKDISYALYHELGHSHNFNISKFGRFLQQCRPLSMYLPALIALYGAFSRKSKPEDGKELTAAQKTNNFIRDNAGKISFFVTIPMLLEEGLATKKGLGWAKKYLSPENFKQVKKGNLIAYTSYLLTAASMGLASWFAVKVKDKLIAKREKAQEELYREAGVI